MSQPMLCAYCGEKCVWPEDFPHNGYAKCARCCRGESAAPRALNLPGFMVALAVAFVLLAACYKCTDPSCSNLPPVDPDYPPPAPFAGSQDAGVDR